MAEIKGVHVGVLNWGTSQASFYTLPCYAKPYRVAYVGELTTVIFHTHQASIVVDHCCSTEYDQNRPILLGDIATNTYN